MNPSMAQRELVAQGDGAEIGLDADGRIAVTSTQLAERLAARRRKPKPTYPPNGNCSGCNTVRGCGPVNEECNPNTVPNCGCRKVQ